MMARGLQALGRLKVGAMNKTEAAYARTLELRKAADEVAWYKFEGLKFRLADNTFYTPDFAVQLNVPQSSFLQLPHKFKAYVAGFGSGKTFVGCAGICAHFWQWPGINQGYFAPTYPQIRDIFYPTMEEVA